MKICFVSAPNPTENGGIGIYVKNLVKILSKDKKNEITLVYRGEKNKKRRKANVNYVEIKVPIPKKPSNTILREFYFNHRVKKFLEKNSFDIINSHATWGYWMKNYKKSQTQKIIHTYHGVTRNFFKTHLRRFKGIKKIIYGVSLIYAKLVEKPPMKMADKIICVSEKVKAQLKELYGERKEMHVLRTGVDLKDFKIHDKNKAKKELNLNPKKDYGLYIGAGSGWNKGLDRAVKLSKEIYKLDKKYQLIVIGPDYNKIKELIKEEFVIFLKEVPRKDIPFYYNSSDIFLCMSRYEGGAPTLVVSEAMGSGTLVACSKSSEQEVIIDGKNGLVLNEFNHQDAKKVLRVLKDKSKKNKIIKEATKLVKGISLEKWTKKYFEILGVK